MERVTSKVVAEVGKDVAHPGVAPLDGDPENIKWSSTSSVISVCLFKFVAFVCLLQPSISILREYQVTLNNTILFSIITVALIWLCRTSQKIWRSRSLSFLILDHVLLDPWSLILSFLILQSNSPSLKYSYTFKLRHHKYYQWVCFTLYFQAILFYIPRCLIITWIGVRFNWAPAVLRPTRSRWIVLYINFDKQNDRDPKPWFT